MYFAASTIYLPLPGVEFIRQGSGDRVLPGDIQVRINVCSHLNIGMAKPLLHILQGKPHGDQHACTAVPQLMKADVGQAVLFQQVIKSVADVVRVIGATIVPFENIVVFLVLTTKCKSVLLLLALSFGENSKGFCSQWKGAATLAFLVLALATTSVTFTTVWRMVIVLVSKSLLSYCRPSSSLLRSP